MLGGGYFQVPAIKYAKEAGYYVITCGYLPDNPGHKYSDEYYNVSIIELTEVLNLAKKLNIDGVIGYASDFAAVTAAYVSEQLNLPSNPYESVKLLTEKDLYREFLKKNNFNAPKACGYSSFEQALTDIHLYTFPVMIKPVDSSGSRGVQRIEDTGNFKEKFNFALSHSKKQRVIIEEFITMKGSQLQGDAFIVDGKIVFCYLGDHHYNTNINPFVPYATTLPSAHYSEKQLEKVENELQKLVDALGLIQGGLNVEVRIDSNDEVYLMEVAPRNGGNHIPRLERYASGFDLVSASVEIAMNNYNTIQPYSKKGYFSNCILHSDKKGVYDNVIISDSLTSNVIEKHVFKNQGDMVMPFEAANASLGILLLEFSSPQEMQDKISNFNEHIKIRLK